MKFLLIILSFLSFQTFGQSLTGAWTNTDADKTTLILATDSYISITEYKPNEFIKTYGGKYETKKGGQVYIKIEFNSADASQVSTQQSYNFKLKKKSLNLNNQEFSRVDDKATNSLTGLWVITGRANAAGEINTITPGARRTYKMMADGHFQWLAINTKTGEFSGTGGGKYTLINGVYTEMIEFFSRDNTRVGAVLNFEAAVNKDQWIHSGKSSKGDPIKEIWTKQ